MVGRAGSLPYNAFVLAILSLISLCTVHQKDANWMVDCPPLNPSLSAIQSFNITDPRVTESSGLAASILHKDVYYTHNDSGDEARVFAFRRDGSILATIQLKGVKAIDFEDMAISKAAGSSNLYIGDIGDNSEKRSDVRVYKFKEPSALDGVVQVSPEIFEIEYPDGPHNAESLLVHPTTGEITLIAKTDKGPSGIFSSGPSPVPGKVRLKRVGQIDIVFPIKEARLITGACWSPDGTKVAVRTYLTAYQYSGVGGDWWKSKPKTLSVPLQRQGEAITYTRDGAKVLTSSEGSPCPVDETPVSR